MALFHIAVRFGSLLQREALVHRRLDIVQPWRAAHAGYFRTVLVPDELDGHGIAVVEVFRYERAILDQPPGKH